MPRSDIIFGIIVKKLITCYHFRDRECHCFFAGLVRTAGDLNALHKRFADNLITFGKSLRNSRFDLLYRLHLGYTKRRATHIRFDETGEPHFLYNLLASRLIA